MFRKAKQRFDSLKGMKVAVLGLTFKPGTDDLREAPSIPNVRRLLDEGAEIVAYDPVGENNYRRLFPTEIAYASSAEEALVDADIAFIFTEWNEIKEVKLSRYKELMKSAVIFDGRNCYELNEAEEAAVDYYSIGRKAIRQLRK